MKKHFNFIAQKGDQARFVENSHLAIVSSWMELFTAKIDIRSTQDGVFVVFGDDHLMRLTDASKTLAEMPIESVKYSDLGRIHLVSKDRKRRWQKIPSLESVLRLMKSSQEKRLILSLKTLDVEGACRLVEHHKLTEQIDFAAGSLKVLQAVKKLNPKLRTYLTISDGIKNFTKVYEEALVYPHVDEIILNIEPASTQRIDQLLKLTNAAEQKTKGITLHIPQVKKEMVRGFLKADFSCFSTDHIPNLQKSFQDWVNDLS